MKQLGSVTTVLALLLFTRGVQAVEAKDVKRASDRAGNWLIEQFDRGEKVFGKGATGKDVTTVAMVVTALCNSPRDYKEANGPYISEPVKHIITRIKKDGSLKDADKLSPEAPAWVRLALESTKNEKYKPLLETLARAGLELKKTDAPPAADVASMRSALARAGAADKAQADALAQELMKLQQKDGSFGEDIQVNALALQALTYCYKAMK